MYKDLKKKLRLEYREKRKQIPVGEKKKSDADITLRLLSSELYTQAQEILCYVSTGDEINTRDIISDALCRGKAVFVPKCTEQKGVMIFYKISSFDELRVERYGLLEPTNTSCSNAWSQSDKPALCVVPTLCCDRFGNRLGYGGGYYDRFLRDFNGKSVCLCYSRFSNVELPVEEHDVPCSDVITG